MQLVMQRTKYTSMWCTVTRFIHHSAASCQTMSLPSWTRVCSLPAPHKQWQGSVCGDHHKVAACRSVSQIETEGAEQVRYTVLVLKGHNGWLRVRQNSGGPQSKGGVMAPGTRRPRGHRGCHGARDTACAAGSLQGRGGTACAAAQGTCMSRGCAGAACTPAAGAESQGLAMAPVAEQVDSCTARATAPPQGTPTSATSSAWCAHCS